MYNEDYLVHYGVLGMRWGQRSRNGIMKNQFSAKRQIDADTEGLRRLNNGEHAHLGVNSKRQAKYDIRDKKYLEARIQATKSMDAAIKAKREMKKAMADMSPWASRDTSEIKAHAEQVKKLEDATYKYVTARIQAKRDLQITQKGKDRVERSQYVRQISKHGLPNSFGDQQNSGFSSRLIKDIEANKGKDYADSVLKGASNRIIGGGVAVLALSGAIITASLLKDG